MPSARGSTGRRCEDLVHAREDVAQVAAAEVLDVALRERLPEAEAAARIRQEHEVALGRQRRRPARRARPRRRRQTARRGRRRPSDSAARGRDAAAAAASPGRVAPSLCQCSDLASPQNGRAPALIEVSGFQAPTAPGADFRARCGRSCRRAVETAARARHRRSLRSVSAPAPERRSRVAPGSSESTAEARRRRRAGEEDLARSAPGERAGGAGACRESGCGQDRPSTGTYADVAAVGALVAHDSVDARRRTFRPARSAGRPIWSGGFQDRTRLPRGARRRRRARPPSSCWCRILSRPRRRRSSRRATSRSRRRTVRRGDARDLAGRGVRDGDALHPRPSPRRPRNRACARRARRSPAPSLRRRGTRRTFRPDDQRRIVELALDAGQLPGRARRRPARARPAAARARAGVGEEGDRTGRRARTRRPSRWCGFPSAAAVSRPGRAARDFGDRDARRDGRRPRRRGPSRTRPRGRRRARSRPSGSHAPGERSKTVLTEWRRGGRVRNGQEDREQERAAAATLSPRLEGWGSDPLRGSDPVYVRSIQMLLTCVYSSSA